MYYVQVVWQKMSRGTTHTIFLEPGPDYVGVEDFVPLTIDGKKCFCEGKEVKRASNILILLI